MSVKNISDKLNKKLDKISGPKDEEKESQKNPIKYSIASFLIYIFGIQGMNSIAHQNNIGASNKSAAILMALAAAVAIVGGINIAGLIKNIKENNYKIASIIILVIHLLFLFSIFSFAFNQKAAI